MTNGNIGKSITKFALPCILARVIQNLYPLMDSLVVGKVLDIDSLSAIGIATNLYSLFNSTLLGLVSGFSIIVSKKLGAGNKKDLSVVFHNSMLFTIVLCIIVSGIGAVFSEQFLLMLDTPYPLIECAKDYISILFLGLILNVLYNFISEMLRAVGNSKMPLILLVISAVVHLIILYPLTKYFGVKGTALSLLLSYVVTIVYGFIYVYKRIPLFSFTFGALRINYNILKECISIGTPVALTDFVAMAGVLILSFVTNNIGNDYIAAYSFASKVGYTLTTPIFGFSTAVSVFVSQNYGAKNYQRIEKGINFSLKIIMVINACIFLIVLAAAKPFLKFALSDNITAVNAGYMYLCIRCISTIFLTPAAVYKSVLPSIGKPLFSTISGCFEVGARFLFPLLFSSALGFTVVPLTDTFAWFVISISVIGFFYYEFRRLKSDFARQ